eukprot:TRINITY_DN51139_c0_g1_i1.p2 TRINITY_DN51139_c0_g1~~TRINITY_DN51139_c0_g1_i1.p2  ORF type:complete len:120 (-),score=23.47 TRINITY_DN51139_c0_g1_i1:319-678(-)
MWDVFFFFFQAEDGIRDVERSRGLGDVYKRQVSTQSTWGHARIEAKTLHYFANGSGRDNYIAYNCGGMFAPTQASNTIDLKSFPRTIHYSERAPQIESKGVRYHADGTGRDIYVAQAYQ